MILDKNRLTLNLLKFLLFIGGLYGLFRTIASISEGSPSVIAPAILIIFTVLLILVNRYPDLLKVGLIFMFVSSLIGSITSFLTRGGLEGPAPYLFFMGFVVVVTLFDRQLRIINYTIIVLTILVLFYFRTALGIELADFDNRINTNGVFIATMVLLCSLILYLKNALVKSQNLIEIKHQEVELANQQLELKTKELQSLHTKTVSLNRNLEEMVTARTEEISQRNNELAEYAYVNAHLLRAPLTRVMGLTQLLEIQNHVAPEKLKPLKSSTEETDRVIKKINEILN